MPLNANDTLLNGQYRVLRRIGQGGFAVVYHARDTLLGRDVAIKELAPSAVGDPEWMKRFLVEARATLDLRGDHIVATHTLFAESGKHYLVMEYVPGGSLEEALEKTPSLPVADAVRIARQVCEGLAYAHHRGTVHCDLKPENILFAANGTAKVADFGIAHVSSHGARSRHWATTSRFIAGTLEYMSPEQIQGKRSDPRIDLYALGALLYQTLTGHLYADFDDSGTPAAIGHNIDLVQHHQPAPPSTHNALVPAWLDDLVLRLLAKRPEDRPGTASDVLALLGPPAPVAQGGALPPQPPAGAMPTGGLPRLPRWARYYFFGALLVVILGVALALLRGGEGTPTPTTVAVVPPTLTETPSPTPSPTHTSTPDFTPTKRARPTLTPSSTPTATPTPTLTPFPGGGRIAFASGTGESLEICVMNVDDGSQICLTDNRFLNESPAWSPDGKRLAFHSRQDGIFDVYVMNADGTGQQNLTRHHDNDGSPSWAPDGRRIAIDRYSDGNLDIYVMDADGSRLAHLTDHLAGDRQPAWSPEGSRLAFVSERDGNAEIYVMNADGSDKKRLTFDPGVDDSPAWSPDGEQIAFFSNRDSSTTEIYVMNADGSNLRRLTENTANDGSPCWSPEGKLIAFDSNRDGNWEIYVMNPDGSAQVNLTNSPADEHFPAWGQ